MVHCSSYIEEDGIIKACACPLLPLSHVSGPTPVSDPGVSSQNLNTLALHFVTHKKNVQGKEVSRQLQSGILHQYRLEKTLAAGTKAIISSSLESQEFLFLCLLSLRNLPKKQRGSKLKAAQLCFAAYRPNGTPNKWWMVFAKRISMSILILTSLAAQLCLYFGPDLHICLYDHHVKYGYSFYCL